MAAHLALIAGSLLLPTAAQAHSFGRPLALPVPLWLYLFGAAAALVLSFLVLGLQGDGPADEPAREPHAASSRVGLLHGVSLAAFALAIAAAFMGSLNPYRNFSMTFFWIVFLLGGLYASAFFGRRIAWINPWRTLLLLMEKWRPAVRSTSVPPSACWPTLVLYVALIAFELFGHGSPRSLGVALAGYTVLTLAAGLWFGGAAWLARGEVFERYFGTAAQLAPPRTLVRLGSQSAADVAVLLFVLFMLSSTAFDGLKETVKWNALYWEQLAPRLAPSFGGNLAKAYAPLTQVQAAINFAVLVLSPLAYLAVCAAVLAACRALMPEARRAEWPLRTVLLAFAPSLIPIAVAYNASHYWTLLLGQGSRLFALLADPFGRDLASAPATFQVAPLTAWHVQVGIILTGHVLGMAICHRRLWLRGESRAVNWRVQLPLLLLMTALTASGLWIMSLPVSPSRSL